LTVPQRITNSIGTPGKRGDKVDTDIKRQRKAERRTNPPHNEEQHN